MTSSAAKVPPLSLSKFGGIWRSGSESDKTDDNLYDGALEHRNEQKSLGKVHNDITRVDSPLPLRQTTNNDISSCHTNGGRSCHPKMRAKFMFRTGDFETCDWGYDWSSSDNESLNKGCTGGHKPVINETSALNSAAENNPLKRKRSDSISEYSSITSETTNPALDDLESPQPTSESFWNMCPVLNINSEENITHDMYRDTMPILSNATEKDLELTENTNDKADDLDDDDIFVTPDSSDDNVYVTEITCDSVTVIFQECQRSKGFFKWQD